MPRREAETPRLGGGDAAAGGGDPALGGGDAARGASGASLGGGDAARGVADASLGGDAARGVAGASLGGDVVGDVRFVGRVSPTRLAELRARAGAAVVPSRYAEILPLTALEAMAAGLPTIAARSGGLIEAVPSEGLYPPGDVAALAQRLTALYRDPTAGEHALATARPQPRAGGHRGAASRAVRAQLTCSHRAQTPRDPTHTSARPDARPGPRDHRQRRGLQEEGDRRHRRVRGRIAVPHLRRARCRHLRRDAGPQDRRRPGPRGPEGPRGPGYEWPAELDEAVSEAAKYHMHIALTLKNGDAGFATAAARNYPAVHLWTLPQTTSNASYRTTLKATYTALKARSKSNRVIAAPRSAATVKGATYDMYGSTPAKNKKLPDLKKLHDSVKKDLFVTGWTLNTGNSSAATTIASAFKTAQAGELRLHARLRRPLRHRRGGLRRPHPQDRAARQRRHPAPRLRRVQEGLKT